MKKIKPNFWKKGWKEIDRTVGGYAETTYEYFETIPAVPLLKAKKADVWYIGHLAKNEEPKAENLIFNEQEAKDAFEGVKEFRKNELNTNRRFFEDRSVTELEAWIEKNGNNKYVGEHAFLYNATSALEEQKYKAELEEFERSQAVSKQLSTMIEAAPYQPNKEKEQANEAKIKPDWTEFANTTNGLSYLQAQDAVYGAILGVCDIEIKSMEGVEQFNETIRWEKEKFNTYIRDKQSLSEAHLAPFVFPIIVESSKMLPTDLLENYGWDTKDLQCCIAKHLENPKLREVALNEVEADDYAFDTHAQEICDEVRAVKEAFSKGTDLFETKFVPLAMERVTSFSTPIETRSSDMFAAAE